MSFARKYGTRAEVFDLGTAEMTRGGLRKEDLILSRTGKIVSKKKSASARENFLKYGFKNARMRRRLRRLRHLPRRDGGSEK